MKKFNSFIDLLSYVNQKMSEGDTCCTDQALTVFADCSLLTLTDIKQVQENSELGLEEKEFLVNLLKSGKKEVWAIVDVAPWEH